MKELLEARMKAQIHLIGCMYIVESLTPSFQHLHKAPELNISPTRALLLPFNIIHMY